MKEKPLLRLPAPRQKKYVAKKVSFGRNISFPSRRKQSAYFEPRFRRLSRTLDDPMNFKDWTHDPASIAPERILVIEMPLGDYCKTAHHLKNSTKLVEQKLGSGA